MCRASSASQVVGDSKLKAFVCAKLFGDFDSEVLVCFKLLRNYNVRGSFRVTLFGITMCAAGFRIKLLGNCNFQSRALCQQLVGNADPQDIQSRPEYVCLCFFDCFPVCE